MSSKHYIFLLLLVPGVAWAEVMDKELSLLAIWCWTAVWAALLFMSARFNPWFLLVVAPLAALFFYAQLSEVIDPFIGPAIRQEVGAIYITSSWGAPCMAVTSAIVGYWLRK